MAGFKLDILPTTRDIIDRSVNVWGEAATFRYKEPNKYRDILNRFLEEEILRRMTIIRAVGNDKKKLESVLHFVSYRENLVNFMVDWCWTFDPRNMNFGLPPLVPWIPWQSQIDFLEWFYNHLLEQKGGLVEKCRDQGATWLFCLAFLHEWRWTNGFIAGVGSNKQDSVDKRDNPNSIFEKIRVLRRNLPSWWLPNEWDEKRYDKNFNMVNPTMNSNIIGECGEDIGRGGRTSVYLVDEAASLDAPHEVDSSLSQTTLCQFDLSTPKGMNHFGRKRKGGKVDVFTFAWTCDPRKNQEWLDEQERIFDRAIVDQEIKINYESSIAGIAIKPEWVDAAMEIELEAKGIKSAGLDVAAGGSNRSALAIRTGPVVKIKSYDLENGIDLLYTAVDACNAENISYLHYDRIGVGHAIYSAIERSEVKMNFQHYGLEAGGKKSDLFYDEFNASAEDLFVNARTEWWHLIAQRFKKTWEHHHGHRKYHPSELISIKKDYDLRSQLCSPIMMRTDSGKMKLESKESMLKRGIKSPDEADALVMAFVPRDAGHKHVVDDAAIMNTVRSFDDIFSGNANRNCLHYGVVSICEDLQVKCFMAIWDEFDAVLWVYDELITDIPSPSILGSKIATMMRADKYLVDKLIGNDEMFSEGKRSFAKELNRGLGAAVGDRQSLKVRQARKYDPYGSLAILIDMVKKRRIVIHEKCVELKKELLTWTLEKGRAKETGMREGLLMLISELIQVRPIIQIMKSVEYKTIIQGDVFSEKDAKKEEKSYFLNT